MIVHSMLCHVTKAFEIWCGSLFIHNIIQNVDPFLRGSKYPKIYAQILLIIYDIHSAQPEFHRSDAMEKHMHDSPQKKREQIMRSCPLNIVHYA